MENICEVMREKNCQPRILYPEFQSEAKIKIFFFRQTHSERICHARVLAEKITKGYVLRRRQLNSEIRMNTGKT